MSLGDQTALLQGTASTGITGLDHILRGGLPRDRVYLVEGDPGTGKTTAALQFLREGLREGESCVYVTLSESANELNAVAASHGWTLDGIDIFELTPADVIGQDEQYTIFDPSEVELSDTIRAVIERVNTVNPSRIVIDSLAEFRLLAREPIRYRRQILALKQFFVGRHSTVLLLDDRSGYQPDLQVQSISHGVLRLEHFVGEWGAERRRIQITKLRGVKYRGGYHDVRIETGGLKVFPRVVAADNEEAGAPTLTDVVSGIDGLDTLLGGGLSTGTSTLIIGPAGVGKTILASKYASMFSQSGARSSLYLFDERRSTFLHRSKGLGLDMEPLVESGAAIVRQLDPGQLSAGELAADICRQVEHEDVKLILIDSLNGYMNAMQDHQAVLLQLHELLSYLNHRDVLTLITVAQHGLVGDSMSAPLDISYLADTVILLRYFEAGGNVRKAISVLKKRTGAHESAIREFKIRGDRLEVGEPLAAFRGILTGVPDFTGTAETLFGVTRDTPA
ncbi:MAG TPA: ATPase domain-containing protein [Vicinamibacterales bacterium]|nr:ATPase domain-containing protein [Vicinamibacterales bacterium]